MFMAIDGLWEREEEGEDWSLEFKGSLVIVIIRIFKEIRNGRFQICIRYNILEILKASLK